ncbi:MAG: DMT family transporter, partial [Rhodospirillaceae bacterium]|nr:DMT family transporter [Rhodospirillaceae bacterium]
MNVAERQSGRLLPLAMLLFGASSYAMTFSLNRIAITEGIPVFPFVFWQGVLAGTIALIAGFSIGQRPKLSGAYLRFYFIFGFIGIGLPYTLLALAAPKVPAGAVALTLTLSPILTYAFSILFKLDAMRLLRVVGILLGLAGILVVLAPGSSLPDPGMAPWLLLAFGSPVCYAFGSVTVVFLRPEGSQPIPLTCGIAFAGAILMLPAMAAADSWWLFDGTMTEGDWSLIGGGALTAVFFVLGLEIIRMVGPVF